MDKGHVGEGRWTERMTRVKGRWLVAGGSTTDGMLDLSTNFLIVFVRVARLRCING